MCLQPCFGAYDATGSRHSTGSPSGAHSSDGCTPLSGTCQTHCQSALLSCPVDCQVDLCGYCDQDTVYEVP